MNQIKFNLKEPSKDESIILMIYRMGGGKRLVMSTGIKILTKHWNPSKQQVREIRGYFEYPAHNNKLTNLKNALRKAETEFAKRGDYPTVLQLKEEINNQLYSSGATVAKNNLNVLKYLEDYIVELKEVLKKSKGYTQSFDQLRNVLSTLRNGPSLQFKDLNNKTLNLLIKHMVDKYKYQTSQIDKIQTRLITLCRQAKRDKYVIDEAVFDTLWKVKNTTLNQNGLAYSESELHKIESVELSEDLDKVRDIFLLGVSVGQRYSDFKGLSKDWIIEVDGKEYFDIVQRKGTKPVKVPVSNRAKQILDKYDGYPPTINNKNFNTKIKKVMKAAKIDGITIIRKSYPFISTDGTISEKIKTERKMKWEVAASHDCRRTYCNLAIKKGASPANVMRVTGHSNLKTFSAYLRDTFNDQTSEIEVF